MRSKDTERSAIALAQTRPQESVETIRVPLLDGGIRGDKAPIDLALNEVVEMESLHLVAGRLVVDTGYAPFGDIVRGTPQREFQAVFDDGTSVVLLITTLTVYEYYAPLDQWQYASLNAAHETTAAYPSGSTVIAVDDATDITVGTHIGILLVGGGQHKTTVTNVAVLDLTIADPIPAGATVALGADVAVAATLTGAITVAQVCIETYPPTSAVIFCNGVDEIMRWQGGIVELLPGFPDPTVCKAIAVFHECLLVGNLIEGGAELSGRIRMSDAGDPEGWDVGVDGIAAVYNLIDTDDPILVLKGLGPWIIVYREASIMKGSYIGALFETIFWEYMLRADGTNDADGVQSQGAVVGVGASHIFVGHAGIWRYTGNYSLESVGEAVFNNFLAVGGDFDAANRVMLFCVYSAPLREMWILYPANDQPTAPDACNRMLRLSLTTGAWGTRRFAHRMVGAGTYAPIRDIITWATAPGTWSDPIWVRAWNSRVFNENVPSIILASFDSMRTFAYDYASITDDGTPISWQLTTGVYGDETIYSRWGDLTILARGHNTRIDYSMDEGDTWTPLTVLSWGVDQPTVQHRWIDRTSTRMQFRLVSISPNFELRRFSVTREQETEW